jgi:hypothetical protein
MLNITLRGRPAWEAPPRAQGSERSSGDLTADTLLPSRRAMWSEPMPHASTQARATARETGARESRRGSGIHQRVRPEALWWPYRQRPRVLGECGLQLHRCFRLANTLRGARLGRRTIKGLGLGDRLERDGGGACGSSTREAAAVRGRRSGRVCA